MLASVVSSRWAPVPNQPVEDGTIDLRVDQVFCGNRLKAGERLTIAGRRQADPNVRFLNARDLWNVLPFKDGDRLLLAVVKAEDAARWSAAAALPADDGATAAVRRACEIETLADPSRRRLALAEALSSRQDLLFRYAVDALGRRRAVSREEGAAIIAQALSSDRLSADSAEALGNELGGRNYYQYELGPDAVNKTAIGALAQRLVGERDSKRAPSWASLLTSSLAIEFSKDPQKDRDTRETLIRSVPEPARHEVPDALIKADALSPGDPRIAALAATWRAALH
jgi:hypothetical protein